MHSAVGIPRLARQAVAAGQGGEGCQAAFVPDRRKLTEETSFALTIWTLVSMGLGVSVVSPQLQQALPVPNVRLVPFEPCVNFSCYAVRGVNRVDQFLVSELMECVRQAIREKN